MSAEQRAPVTDSPWFFVFIFSLMALLALLVIGGKYGRRQANIERQYQARTRVAEKLSAENNPAGTTRIDIPEPGREYATPDNKLIPLWPLATLLGLIAILSAAMLLRASRAVRSAEPAERPGPDNEVE